MEKTHPSPHFHPLMRPSQGHGDSGEGRNPEGWGEGIIPLELVAGLGRTAPLRKLHDPACHVFHPLMRPSQRHDDAGEKPAPYPDTGPESRCGEGEMWRCGS